MAQDCARSCSGRTRSLRRGGTSPRLLQVWPPSFTSRLGLKLGNNGPVSGKKRVPPAEPSERPEPQVGQPGGHAHLGHFE